MKGLLIEAATLLGVGMSVVFLFLTLLIACINVIAWYVKKYPEPSQVNRHNNNILLPTTVKPEIVAAISAAVHAHRNK